MKQYKPTYIVRSGHTYTSYEWAYDEESAKEKAGRSVNIEYFLTVEII